MPRFLVGLWLLLQPALVLAQQAEQKPDAESPARSSDGTSLPEQSLSSESGTTESLKPVVGQSVIVDRKLYEEFQKYRDSPKVPRYDIVSVALQGEIEGDSALLTATVKILVHRADEWVKVTLDMGEATLSGFDIGYEGAGKWSPGTPENREPGHQWWFSGEGEHELTLPLVVPLLKPVPARRLALSIPRTASSRLVLKVSAPKELLVVKPPKSSQKPPRISPTHTRSISKDESEIVVIGLGRRLDLQWETRPDRKSVNIVLSSNSLLTLQPSGDKLRLTVQQLIAALEGGFSEVRVSLPAGFTLLNVEGKRVRSHELVGNSNVAVVKLTEVTSGRVELNWTMEAEFPKGGEPFIIEGFEVESAAQQRGDIRVEVFPGHDVSQREAKCRFVHRRDGSDVAENTRLISVYEFTKQPFRLALDLKETDPYFSVRPELFLKLTAETAELDARFAFEVPDYGGALDKVFLRWPDWSQQGWKIEVPGSLELVGRFDIDAFQGEDVIQIPLVKKKGGRFELRLNASRTIPSDGERFDITLPLAEASRPHRTSLFVTGAENVVIDLIPKSGTSVVSIPAQVEAKVSLPEEFGEASRLEFYVSHDSHAFEGTATVHDRSVNANSTLTLFRREDQLLVKQRIRFDVKYAGLQRLRFDAPAELTGPIEFYTNDNVASDNTPKLAGSPLPTQTIAGEQGQPRKLAVDLRPSRIGNFDVVARYTVILSDHPRPSHDVTATVPMLLSSDAPYDSIVCRYNREDDIVAVLTDPAWQSQIPEEGWSTWIIQKAQPHVPLLLKYTRDRFSQPFSVEKALVRTSIDSGGIAHSRGHYLVNGLVSEIAVSVPPSIVLAESAIWWNRDRIPEASIDENPPGSGQLRIPVSTTSESERNLLTIEFHSANGTDSAIARRLLAAPAFPPEIWVNRALWIVSLPSDEHLATVPAGFTPEFQWRRNRLFWSRMPNSVYQSPTQWFGESATLPREDLFAGGNTYAFSRFGPVESIAIRSLTSPMVVLFGAGIALATGLVLIKFPATRSVLTLLVFTFALALLGLWFSATMELLLQPAVLGLAFATVAAFIESVYQRRRSSPSISFSAHSDFVLPSSQSSYVEYPAQYGVGSEDPTAVRPPPEPKQEPISSSSSAEESGTA